MCEVTFELYNASLSSNINIAPGQKLCSVREQSETDSRNSLSGRVNLGKRELNTAISTIQEKVARALNVTPDEINLDISTTEDVDLLRIKAENFDRLMQLIKEKLSTIKTNREIIQVLTLAPETWSIKKVANFFNVTEYAARKARSLVQERGILVLPDKKGKKLISRYN